MTRMSLPIFVSCRPVLPKPESTDAERPWG